MNLPCLALFRAELTSGGGSAFQDRCPTRGLVLKDRHTGTVVSPHSARLAG